MQNLPSSEGGVLPIAAAGAMPETHYSIDQLLEQVVAQNASDLHVTAGTAPILRLKGHLCRMEGYPILSPEDTRQLLYRVMSTEQQKQLEIDRQIDMAHSIPGLARFRVNVYYQRGALGAAFRLIPRRSRRSRSSASRRASTSSRRSRAASCSSPARPAPVSRRRSRR